MSLSVIIPKNVFVKDFHEISATTYELPYAEQTHIGYSKREDDNSIVSLF